MHILHKTYTEKLRPTPAQERALEDVLWRCRDLYNAALEQRITAWQRRRVSVSRYESCHLLRPPMPARLLVERRPDQTEADAAGTSNTACSGV